MPDDAQNILSPVQVDNSIKANAWEAFNSAKNENELGVRLQGMNLPQDVKARLWEAKKSSGIQIPDPVAQAQAFTRSQIKPLIPGTGTVDPTGGLAEAQKTPGYQGYMKASGQMAAGAAGGMAGGALAAPLLPGAAEAGGGNAFLKWLLPKLASTSAAGMGGGAGALTQGATPKEALEASAGGTMAGMTLEGMGAGARGVKRGVSRQIAKLSGETPERLATLKALPEQEAAINQKIVQAEAQSRAAFKQAYPKIDEAPVNVATTKNLAKQAGDNIVSARVPSQVSRIADIPEPSQNVLTSEDPNVILKELAGFDNIPFRKAQLYRSALEKFISSAGGKLPSDIYGQIKAITGSLTDGLKATATREGVLPQFNTAESMFKQHAADFWNKGAPLKGLVNTPADATGSTLNRFMQTANRARIMQALERRGVPTDDIKGILTKGDKAVKTDIKDAARLKQLGPDIFNQQVGAANRAATGKWALKGALGATGVGTIYELYRALAREQP